MWRTVLFVCFSVGLTSAQNQNHFRVEVEIEDQGLVWGYKAPNHNVYTFYNIPYAQTPLGKDKFKAPLPAPKWSEPLDAINRNIVCPQNLGDADHLNMVEDCLVANIYVPDIEETDLPVLVMVHGGGFQEGYGTEFEPMSLVSSKNIIAVSFNYRLGIHGFLCLGLPTAPGNAGLKDQVALLRWVKKNIASFGGNSNDVTVSGCSAGGGSVDLLLVSKLADGLMHKVLTDSGSSMAAFAVQFDPLQNAYDYAEYLKFNVTDDITALSDFYTALPFETLIEYRATSIKDGSLPFTSCVEKYVNEEMFLDSAPIKMFQDKNYTILPTLYGYTDLEGSIQYYSFNQWQPLMHEKFSDFLPADLEFKTETEKEEIATKVKQFYFGDTGVSAGSLQNYLKYFSDVMFIYGIMRSAKLQVRAGNNEVYLYEYSFARSDRPAVPDESISGAGHCFQLFAVMDEDESSLPEDYVERKELIRALWGNFIKSSNPTPAGWNSSYPNWPPTGENHSPYYSLGQDVVLGGVALENSTAFWDPIYDTYYRTPKIPAPSASTVNSLSVALLFVSVLQILAKLV